MPSAGNTVAELQVVVSADTREVETGLSSLGQKLGGIGGALTTAFTGAAIAGIAGLAAGFGASVAAAAEFEQAMSAISAVSGASAQEMAALQQTALDLGKATSFSAKEAAAGIEELVKAGVSVEDVIGGGAKAALDLAAAGGIEVADAAEIAANAMNVFNKSGAEMGQVADQIAGAVNTSAIGMNDYKFALAASGAVAATVGLSFEDLNAAIAAMGNAGIKGSDAGTSLKTMLMNLIPSTNKQKDLFRELGIITADGANQFFDASGKIKSMAEVAGVLQTALAGMTEEQKLSTLETMFGSDAIRAAAVIANEGAEGFNQLAADIGKVTAAQVASERLNNLKGSLEQLKGSLETAAITLGLAFLPLLRQGVDGLTAFVNSIIPLAEEWGPKLVAVIQGWGASLAAMDWSPLMNTMAQIGTVFSESVLPALQEVAVAIIELFGGVVSWFQENWPLIAQTFATVSGQVEGHNSAMTNGIISAWQGLRAEVTARVTELGQVIRLAMQTINGDWQGAWQTLAQLSATEQQRMTTETQRNAELWVAAIDRFTNGSGTAFVTWADATGQTIAQWFSTQATAFGDGFAGFVEASSTGMASVTEAINAGWQSVSDFVAGIMPTIQQTIMAMWDALPEDIRADLVLIANHLTEQGQAWVSAITTAGQEMFNAVTQFLAQMAEAVTTWAASTFLAPIQQLVGAASSTMTEVGGGMATSLSTALSQILSEVRGWVSSFVSAIRGIVGQVSSAAREVGQSIAQGIASGISAGASAIRSAALSAARAALQAAKSALGIDSPSKVFALEVGRPSVEGIINGINDMTGPLARTVAGLVEPPPAMALAGVGVGRGPVAGSDIDYGRLEQILVRAAAQRPIVMVGTAEELVRRTRAELERQGRDTVALRGAF